jgi:hypothetical protein
LCFGVTGNIVNCLFEDQIYWEVTEVIPVAFIGTLDQKDITTWKKDMADLPGIKFGGMK